MRVSRTELHRGLLLAHGVMLGAIKRGWSIEAFQGTKYGNRPGVAIAVQEHRYPIEVVEETRRLPFSDRDIEKWRNEHKWDLAVVPDHVVPV
jgi:hypothetical protein